MTLQAAKPPKQWERMPDESTKAYAAFNTYLQLGPNRSLDEAYCAATEKPQGSTRVSGQWRDWSSQFRWFARATAWDSHIAEAERNSIQDQAEDNARERVKALRGVLGQGIQIISRARLETLSTSEARQLLPQAIKAIELATDGLREEFGTPSRPTTERSLQITGDLGSVGAVEIEAFDDKELLTRIAAKEQGILTDGFDPNAYEVNGRGELIPIEGRS